MTQAAGPRFAIYYAPQADDPLAKAGASWLGRDADTNAPIPQPDHPDIAEITGDARGYGFHATLKPPMRLAPGRSWPALQEATQALARSLQPFELPALAVTEIGGFLALCPPAPSHAARACADATVEALDLFRAPPGEAELARRRKAGLTPAQETLLRRWGYPYLFDEWTFHMTLTRRLGTVEIPPWRARAEAHFADALARSRRVADLCIFAQAGPERPFVLAGRFPLGASA